MSRMEFKDDFELVLSQKYKILAQVCSGAKVVPPTACRCSTWMPPMNIPVLVLAGQSFKCRAVRSTDYVVYSVTTIREQGLEVDG